VDATFDEYTSGAADYSGKNIPNSPSHTYSIGSTCRFLDHWMVNAELNGAGTIYYTADNNKSQGSYQVVNVKAGYETDRFDLYLWARNLFDEAYATRAFQMGSDWWARNGDPLTLGLTFRYRF
jgi:iron complex outermembrane receptor protein